LPVIKLYYYPSFICLVPHIVLEEIGAQYELVFVNLSGGPIISGSIRMA
jgi:glutathione S-transferase